jgi:AcrR family transcriptional regulator
MEALPDTASSLRDRRRLRTAREIQHITLRLIRQNGFEAVTTEMIAQAADISVRTFFNYYPNKEAAAVGPPPQFDMGLVARFQAGRGAVVADFAELVRGTQEADAPEKDKIHAIHDFLETYPSMVPAFHRSLAHLTAQMAAALVGRLGADRTEIAYLLADVLILSMSRSIKVWVQDDAMGFGEMVDLMVEHLTQVGGFLAA